MPESRPIKRKTADDYRLSSVSIEAECLYYKMLPWLDREGRLKAEPKLVNKLYYPLRDYTNEQVEGWLAELHEQKKNGYGLIQLYEVEGRQYLWYPGFLGEQSRSWRYDREAASVIPPPGVADKPEQPKQASPGYDKSDILDAELASLMTYYESNIGMLTPTLADRLKDDHTHYPAGWTEKAIDEAVVYNKRNLKYIEAILKRWQAEGIQPSESSDTLQSPDKSGAVPL